MCIWINILQNISRQVIPYPHAFTRARSTKPQRKRELKQQVALGGGGGIKDNDDDAAVGEQVFWPLGSFRCCCCAVVDIYISAGWLELSGCYNSEGLQWSPSNSTWAQVSSDPECRATNLYIGIMTTTTTTTIINHGEVHLEWPAGKVNTFYSPYVCS